MVSSFQLRFALRTGLGLCASVCHVQELCNTSRNLAWNKGLTRKPGDLSQSDMSDKGLLLCGQASKEILCMLTGVACAALATLAQSQARRDKSQMNFGLLLLHDSMLQ